MSDSATNPQDTDEKGNGRVAGAAPLDSRAQEVATVYAKALLAAAETAGSAAKIADEAAQITAWLAGQPKFEAVLASELLGDDEKQGIINRVFVPRYDKTLVDFLRILSRRDRLGLLGPILPSSAASFTIQKEKFAFRSRPPRPCRGPPSSSLPKRCGLWSAESRRWRWPSIRS